MFWTRRESACEECGRELGSGSLIQLRDGTAWCLECADLGHLVFLPRGDTALTRRAGTYSGLSAVVVQWSRSRKRYERQGLLVEEPALRRAEEECLSDADAREARRFRAASARERQDRRLVEGFARAVRERFPGCPEGNEVEIAERACERYSGRIGRSAAGRAITDDAVDLAVRAHVRHRFTRYDHYLMEGRDRNDARAQVRDEVDFVLAGWREKLGGRASRAPG